MVSMKPIMIGVPMKHTDCLAVKYIPKVWEVTSSPHWCDEHPTVSFIYCKDGGELLYMGKGIFSHYTVHRNNCGVDNAAGRLNWTSLAR
ncbi:unnamed protein product [Cyberlindnera jadinii]|uniref:Uncharacterized protein n=1 Tax=Cyberlindnera jadinii (strain ATCC 18201 / CBS 1600 / BCRC 20928 / JCM 3617 / NBRC 0987 / NRRL Y-1542) TaxID=983966 RepID=A0A0H5C0X4_CYBJN|nr:unnamed protein product [Cyberlindnera jadinii]